MITEEEISHKNNNFFDLSHPSKGKLKKGKPDVDNSGKGNEAKPKEDIEENKLRFQYGEFHELKFGVKGSVWSTDEQVLRIKGFHYDGKGLYS